MQHGPSDAPPLDSSPALSAPVSPPPAATDLAPPIPVVPLEADTAAAGQAEEQDKNGSATGLAEGAGEAERGEGVTGGGTISTSTQQEEQREQQDGQQHALQQPQQLDAPPAADAGATLSASSGVEDHPSPSLPSLEVPAEDAQPVETTATSAAEQPPAPPAIVEPTPSNPAAHAASSALLSRALSPSPATSTERATASPPPASSSPAPARAPSASPTPSASAGTATASPALLPQKKFQSSLAVNKKFLEKAGEKAHKAEVKPVTARLSTPPVPAPVSTSHPRLFAGKLSSSPSVTLSSSSTAAPALGWNKKPGSPAPGSSAPGASAAPVSAGAPGLGLAGAKKGGPVWGAPSAAPGGRMDASGLGMGMGAGSRLGAGMGGAGMGVGGAGGWGPRRDMVGEFPTAAEAAHAKEARARAMMEQVQARERAMQARAAATAAHNAHLLEGLDAFRGVHLDPNAAHWDEDDDDFLDTTIEFADGTQYKIDASAPPPSGGEADDELREPGPAELALREKPLAPGEVVEPPRREERFGDDFDRSWPPRHGAGAHGDAKNLFNARLDRFEPAASGAVRRPAPGEPTSILSASGKGHERRPSGSHDAPPHHHSQHERRTSGSFDHHPPHGHGHPPAGRRRPSVTSPPTRQVPLPGVGGGSGTRRESFGEQQKGAVWGRRTSSELHGAGQGRPLPPHLAAAAGLNAGATGGRQLPPHLQHQSQQAPPTQHRASLSPPSQRLPLPAALPSRPPPPAAELLSPTAPAPAPTPEAPTPAAPAPVVDIEAEHAQRMHEAAERAKKRREEEEQERVKQQERARRKAEEMAEKMRKLEQATAPAPAVVQEQPPSAAEKVASWRAQAKPLAPVAPAPAPAAAEVRSPPVPTKVLQREPPAQSQEKQAPAPAPSAWRRPLVPPTAPAAMRGLPPHLAVAQAAQAAKAAPPAQAVPAPAPPIPVVQPAPAEAPAQPSAPAPAQPPAAAASSGDAKAPLPPAKTPTSPPALPLPPSSPSTDRKAAAAAAKLGYKQPAVSQLDDLMSRIKGAMSAPDQLAGAPAPAAVEPPVPTVPTVKLPSAAPKPGVSVLPPASAPTPPNPTPTVALPPPTEPRSRRGRNATPRTARPATFEDREPILPIHSTRLARSESPPPAWRQYTVRLSAHPPRRAPPARQVKNFHNLHHPRPVYSLAFEPPMQQINTNRLTRDDWLMPKRYFKGVVQYSVQLSSGKLVRARREERARGPTPSVSISSKELRRAAALPEPPKPAEPVEATSEFLPFGRGRGRGRAPESGTWRRAADLGAVPTASLADVQVAAEQAEEVLASEATPATLPAIGEVAPVSLETSPTRTRPAHKKMPEGSSLGFYRDAGALGSQPLDRQDSAQMFMVTSELNGEKVETTPRKETTAPGADLAGGKAPGSPVFTQQDLNPVMASPSSSSAWPNKSLVLNPTVASVWSAPPVDGPVHSRVASGVQLENSLQGIADDDPSEALPNSLADLKSEDGLSTEDKERAKPKDEAKLRAAAPSFSSFLHEKAASIDSSSVAASPVQFASRPQPPAFSPAFPHQIPPQSTPSPINPFSPAQTYSPQLHSSLGQYGRPTLAPSQSYSSYPLSGQAVSPFLSQPSHVSAYSPQSFAPHSPALQPIGGYPSSPYRDPTQQPIGPPQAPPPGHITNPALLANFFQSPLSSPVSRGYGAVGAGGPGGPGAPGRPLSGAGYGRGPMHVPPPTSYIASGYGNTPYQAQSTPQQPYRLGGESPYGSYVGGAPPSAQPDLSRAAPPPPPPPSGYSGTTMASPVIMPQQPPQVPLFGLPAHQHGHGLQHGHGGLPSAVSAAAGIGPFAGTPPGGAYGAPGGYGRPQMGARTGTGMSAGGMGRGW